MATPFCKTYGLFFDDKHEPEDFKFLFDKDVETNLLCNSDDCINITSPLDNPNEYYDYILRISDMNRTLSMHEEVKNTDNYYYINIPMDDCGGMLE